MASFQPSAANNSLDLGLLSAEYTKHMEELVGDELATGYACASATNFGDEEAVEEAPPEEEEEEEEEKEEEEEEKDGEDGDSAGETDDD